MPKSASLQGGFLADSEKAAQEKIALQYEWFFFDNTEDAPKIARIDSPADSPRLVFAPWAEAVHVASSGQYNKGYFLVNHFGMLMLENGKETFLSDKLLLESKSIGEMFFLNTNPVFHVFKNSVFTVSDTKYAAPKSVNKKTDAVFIQYDLTAKNFLPYLTKEKLSIDAAAEVTEAFFKDGLWHLAVKNTTTPEQNEQGARRFSFDYLTLKVPANTAQPISESAFQEASAPEDFSMAPVRIKRLLNALTLGAPNFEFTLVCALEESMQNKTFRKHAQNDAEKNSLVTAHAVLTPEYALALFPDGTCYFSGSIYGRPLLNNGEETAFRLPQLPAGFIYTHCIIAGRTLFAAWEERSFYKIGRSGFIKVDLDAVLFSNPKN